MRVPSFSGRIAWVAFVLVAMASVYLLDGMPPQYEKFGGHLALAGGAVCLGCLQVYRKSFYDLTIPNVADPDGVRAKRKALLLGISRVALFVSLALLFYYVAALNYGLRLIPVNPLYCGVAGFLAIGIREIVRYRIVSDMFQENVL